MAVRLIWKTEEFVSYTYEFSWKKTAPFTGAQLNIQAEFEMIGSLITRGLLLIFGYAYPAYECYKTVEMNKPDIQQLGFWCQYWILVAWLTVLERIGDVFVSWVPMYGEAKLAFFIYLWFPKTKGTTYVYDSFFRPYLAKHETEIDGNLLKLRIRVGDMAVLYWQKAASYGQTRVFDILQYVASQSATSQPAQPRRQVTRVVRPSVPENHTPAAAPELSEDQSSPHPSTLEQEVPSEETEPETAPATLHEQKTTPTVPLTESTKTSTSNEGEAMQLDSVPPSTNENPQPPEEIILQDNIPVTQARFRRTSARSIR